MVLILKTSSLIANRPNVDSLIKRYDELLIENNDTLLYELCHDISEYSYDPEKKLFYARRAYEDAKKYNKKWWMASSKYFEALAYGKKMVLDSAVISVLEAKGLYEESGSKEGIALCHLYLSQIYRINKEYSKSEKSFYKTIELYKQLNDTWNLAITYINIGELYRETKRFDEAIGFFNKSDSLFVILKDIKQSALCKGNIGLIYLEQNKLDTAIVLLNYAISILKPLGNNYAVSYYMDGKAKIFLKQNKIKKAEQTSLKSLELAQEHGLKEQIRDASYRLSTIYHHSADFEKAFFYHKQYVAYRDSINNEDVIRKIASLNAKYEIAKKQKELDAEKEEKEMYLVLIIGAFMLVMGLVTTVLVVLKTSRYRKQVNQKLEVQSLELAKANTTKNKFFSILSHDLRSPLASFHSYSEVIDLCIQHNEVDKLSEFSSKIKVFSSNLLDLLDNLLQWGLNQMESGQTKPSRVNLKEIIILEKTHLQHVAENKEIAVYVDVDKSVTLYVDRVQISMALRNLLNNAIKFTPSGGNIHFESNMLDDQVVLKVSDTGIGMTKEQQNLMFDSNEIHSTSGTQNEKGVGLGMQLVLGFIEESKSKIEVESELGKGTTFTITFKKEQMQED